MAQPAISPTITEAAPGVSDATRRRPITSWPRPANAGPGAGQTLGAVYQDARQPLFILPDQHSPGADFQTVSRDL